MSSDSEGKAQFNVRLSVEAMRIIRTLSALKGISQAALLEEMLRMEAARLKLRGYENSPLRNILPAD